MERYTSVKNNLLIDNSISGFGGGGIEFWGGATVNLINNIFYENSSTGTEGGGGLLIHEANNTILVRNCIFWDNTADSGENEIELKW